MRKQFFLTVTLALAGLAVPAIAGTIYVADYNNVYKLSSGGVASTFATGTGDANIGMAFNSAGDLFVDSRDNNAIYEITPSGVVSQFATVSSPYGLAVDAAGDVFTSSPITGTIIEFSPSGVASTFATDSGGYGYSLAIDPVTGYLFEGDNNENIYEYSPTGARSTFASGLSEITEGITFDQSGDVFAANWSNEILKFTPSGTESVFATLSSNVLPTGLAYDYATNTLYMAEVADGIATCCTQQVDAFTTSGVESTFTTGLFEPFGLADSESQTPAPATPEPGTFGMLAGAGLVALSRVRRVR